ncbi:uncharacterized protein LOC112527510 [Cynara cardunculus var. scolymus]|uniref:uncharacterized protein LOC112527510 n=1 Tax=Cynara cardunculus var. scolymus TaxID=59895 RepID=UPI000D62F04B|nr:uncharacterized protein LOC112527510 [Cynara cardunculus var. scolymus]
MDRNHILVVVKVLKSYIDLLILLVNFANCDIICVNELRMDRNAFAILCELLKTRGGLLDDGNVTIEEQVATFVNILAHHTKNRCLQVRFYRSGETISRYVHRVLSALLRLQDILFSKPTPVEDDCTDRRWKWFKGCIGAIDGTYIEVTVPESDKPRYRTRKGHIAINVLERCFGILKKRWAILRSPSFYPIKLQGRMVIACALLHNFIRMYMVLDPEENTTLTLEDMPIGEEQVESNDDVESIDVVESSNEWTQWRDDIAQEMFESWISST